MDRTISDGDFTRIWALAVQMLGTPQEMDELTPDQMHRALRGALTAAFGIYGEFLDRLKAEPIVLPWPSGDIALSWTGTGLSVERVKGEN